MVDRGWVPCPGWVVGGEAAIGPGVESALSDYPGEVCRVAGPARWATAAAVSQHRGITPQETFVATGQDFPDVLAAAPAGQGHRQSHADVTHYG